MSVTGWDWWVVVGGALQVVGVLVLAVDLYVTVRRVEGGRFRHRRRMARPEEETASRVRSLERIVLADTAWDRRRRLASIAAVVLGVVVATIGSVAG